jgi:GMP reductase
MPELYIPQEDIFDYDDVILVPEKCIVQSRSQVSTTATLGGHEFALPVVPANMSTVVDENTCAWLAERGFFYVMHRFDVDAVAFTKSMQEKGFIASISLGIKQADYDIIERFVAEGLTPEFITVDVAHGDSEEVFKVVRTLREKLPKSYVIAGNVATAEGALRLTDAGVNAIKVGIGPGSACLTAPNTGFGSAGWQLSAVANVVKALEGKDIQVVADGGIRHYGDIAKSVAFGADFIMAGGFFAGMAEGPGEIIEIDGEFKKEFFGSASEHQKGEHKHVEGRKLFVPYKGSMETVLQIIKENLQSSISYAGGNKLVDLHNVKYALVRK